MLEETAFFSFYADTHSILTVLFCIFKVHDIVLEYVLGQMPANEQAAAQRSLIQLFRESRPAGGWQRKDAMSNQTTRYITHEIGHHMQAGWQRDFKPEDSVVLELLTDHVCGPSLKQCARSKTECARGH